MVGCPPSENLLQNQNIVATYYYKQGRSFEFKLQKCPSVLRLIPCIPLPRQPHIYSDRLDAYQVRFLYHLVCEDLNLGR